MDDLPQASKTITSDSSSSPPWMTSANFGVLYGVVIALHAFTESGERAWLFLVAALSEPSLDGPHVPVQLLGQALQPLFIWVLARQKKTKQNKTNAL